MENTKRFFKRPKEIVISLIAVMVTSVYCYGFVVGSVPVKDFKTIVVIVVSFYYSTKSSLSKPEGGNGTTP